MTTVATGALLELEAQMAVMARRLRRVVSERATAVDPSLGAVGYGVLEHLQRHGDCRQTDLVAALGVEKGAISRAVQQLVDLGLAGRVEDPDDGRACRVRILDLGAARLRAVLELRRAAYAERLADWTPDDLDAFVAMLTRYNAALETPLGDMAGPSGN
jgi:DNA-binding MarR family transcriptional regulator